METLHYDAFISYRHTPKDTAVAKELQQSLERFRIPKSIRAAYGKDRIDRIFRDQEDLEMTSDLSKKLDDSLRASDFLIVVCSPDYMQSEWCLHELETFIGLKGADKVLCVLAEGEPPAIFPDILLSRKETDTADDGTVFTRTVSTEPLACDFRGSLRDARRTELPRLVSAIIGCGYDELMLRQERYRRRRAAAVLTGVLSVSAIAISYLLWSNAQINRNFRQSQINESRMLSKEAMSSLDSGDRLSALRRSLEAVGDGDRPVVDEAVMALTSSSYAYSVPGKQLENWRIDTVNDISSFCLSEDGSYLTAMDRLGSYHGIDMSSRREVFRVDAGSSVYISDPVSAGGSTVICVSGTVKAFNPSDGSVLWETPLKYGLVNSLAVSPDRSLIAAADSYAVQIMDTSGEPFLSLPLPGEEEGYITDLIWSPDGKEITVYIKQTLMTRVGVFDVQTSDFFPVTAFCSKTSACYTDDGDLYVFCCGETSVPESEGHVSTIFPVDYEICRVRHGSILWKSVISTDSVVSLMHADIIPGYDGTLITLGGSFYRLSADGSVLGQMDTGGVLSDILQVGENQMDLVMTDGRHCIYVPQNDTIYLTDAFPSGYEQIEIVSSGPSAGTFALLKDGNISFYSALSDENVSFWTGKGFSYPPLSSLRSKDRLLLYADGRLILYDTSSGTVVNDGIQTENSPYHLLTVIDGTAYALRVDQETSRFILCSFDLSDGEKKGEVPLPVAEFYTSLGLVYNDDSYISASMIDTLYIPPSPVALRGSTLCMHDWDDPNRIFIYDISAGTSREIRADLEPDCYLISSEVSVGPAPLLISEDGRYVFSVRYDMNDSSILPVMISLEDGSVSVLESDINDLSSAVFADGCLLFSGKDSLHELDQHGGPGQDIPFSGDNAISFTLHKGRTYCVFPDMTMTVFINGDAERTVSLGIPPDSYAKGKAYRYEFTDDRLYLFRDHDMCVISLYSDSASPLYTVTGSVIDADPERGMIICYGTHGSSGDENYQVVSFAEYSVDELTLRSREQLDQFLLVP